MTQLLRSPDGWDYKTVTDRLLGRKANSPHNLRRVADAMRLQAELNLRRMREGVKDEPGSS